MTDSNCISLQDHHQQQILITRNLMLKDSFSLSAAQITNQHLQISQLDIWMVVIAPSFKIDEFLHKIAITSKIFRVEQKNHCFLTN